MKFSLPRKLPFDTLVKGQVVHRIGSMSFKGDKFNDYPWLHYTNNEPSENKIFKSGRQVEVKAYLHRFSPFTVDGKASVPILYISLTEHGAIVETLIRPNDFKVIELTKRDIDNREMSQLKVTSEIHLASCYCAHFDKGGDYNPSYLKYVEPALADYQGSELFAKAIYQHSDHVDGIAWYSSQDKQHTSIVLFDRAISKIQIDKAKSPENILTSDRLLASLGRLSQDFNRSVDDDLKDLIVNTGRLPSF